MKLFFDLFTGKKTLTSDFIKGSRVVCFAMTDGRNVFSKIRNFTNMSKNKFLPLHNVRI